MEVKKDESFYLNSGGGVTISGGEPLAQFEFTKEFLKRCKEHHLHTAIETCGYVPWRHIQEILEFVNVIYYDIKHIDPAKHGELTGVSNDLILENARRLLSTKKDQLIIRVPIIPGCNDSEENIRATANFVAERGGKAIEFLPYHRLGISKYGQLDREYELREAQRPSDACMRRLRSIVQSVGVMNVTCGS